MVQWSTDYDWTRRHHAEHGDDVGVRGFPAYSEKPVLGSAKRCAPVYSHASSWLEAA